MIIIKYVVLTGIFILASAIGFKGASKLKNRVNDLKTVRSILSMLKTKINYTYEPLPRIFETISQEYDGNIGNIFKMAKMKMSEMSAGEAWHFALENSTSNMNEEDLRLLHNFEKLLGKTNIDGQIAEINLMEHLIEEQIEKADIEQKKNEKLYRNLGVIFGIAIVIILI